MSKLAAYAWVGLATTAPGCGGSSTQEKVCDPFAAVTLPLVPGTFVAAGTDADRIVYAIDEAPAPARERLFVSQATVLNRRAVSGSGEVGGTGPGGYLVLTSRGADDASTINVAVEFGATGASKMGLLRGPLATKSFTIGSVGEVLTLVDAAAIAGYTKVNLPGTFSVEHAATLSDGRVLVVTSPDVDGSYEQFRVFFGAPDHVRERPLGTVTRGSYTVVTFSVDGQQGTATFGSSLAPAVTSQLVLGSESFPLTVAAPGEKPAGVTYDCASN